MGSFSDLNGFGNTTVNFTDNRNYGIKLFPPVAKNIAFTSTTATFPADVSTNIESVIKPEFSLPVYEINISYVPGATVTWDPIPPGCTTSSSNGIFQITGITSASVWQQIKSPTITLPPDFQGNVLYEGTIYWTTAQGPQSVTWDVGVYVPAALLSAQFIVDFDGDAVTRTTAAINSIFGLSNNLIRVRDVLVNPFNSAFVQPDVFAVRILDLQSSVNSEFSTATNLSAIRRFNLSANSVAAIVPNASVNYVSSSSMSSTTDAQTQGLRIKQLAAAMTSQFNSTMTATIAEFGESSMTATAAMTVNARSHRNGLVITYIPSGTVSFTASNCTDVVVEYENGTTQNFGSSVAEKSFTMTMPNTGSVGSAVITGVINGRFRINSLSGAGVTSIDDFGNLGITDLSYAFSNIHLDGQTLKKIARVPASVTNTSFMFFGSSNFNGDLVDWNSTGLTNVESMFRDATSYNRPLNTLNVSSVTNMSNMFFGATAFNQPLNDWNTSSVTNMSGMFQNSNYNNNISTWDTSSVTNMSNMFAEDVVFNQNINSWNTISVTNMSGMFLNANAYNQPMNNWNTSNVTAMNLMFFDANNFNGNISTWDTGSATTMRNMFASAVAFNQNISDWDTSSVSDMTSMFNNATAFNQNLSGWCVTLIPSAPSNFDTGATAWTLPRPVWGTCPA